MDIRIFYLSVGLFVPLSSRLCSTVPAKLPHTYVCIEDRVSKHTAIPRTSLLSWRWKPVRNRFILRVRHPRSQTELLVRDVGPLQHLHLHNTTQTQKFHAFSEARTYDPILQEVKDLHLRTRDHHNLWFRANRSYCLVKLWYVEQYMVIMVTMIILSSVSTPAVLFRFNLC
jgi:hypothetical protein